MSIDLRCLRVSVAKELLDCSERLPGSRETGGECVAQVMKANHSDAGIAARLLEPLAHLRSIRRRSNIGLRTLQHSMPPTGAHGQRLQAARKPAVSRYSLIHGGRC